MNTLIHSLILYVFPLFWGAAAYCLIGRRLRSVFWQFVICGIATLLALVLEYCSILVFLGLMTGSWPEEITYGGLAYGFLWFAIPGCFVSAPQVLTGYGLTWLFHAWKQRYRPT